MKKTLFFICSFLFLGTFTSNAQLWKKLKQKAQEIRLVKLGKQTQHQRLGCGFRNEKQRNLPAKSLPDYTEMRFRIRDRLDDTKVTTRPSHSGQFGHAFKLS